MTNYLKGCSCFKSNSYRYGCQGKPKSKTTIGQAFLMHIYLLMFTTIVVKPQGIKIVLSHPSPDPFTTCTKGELMDLRLWVLKRTCWILRLLMSRLVLTFIPDEADHADCDIPLTQRDSSIFVGAKIACGYGRTDLVWEEFDETAFDDVVLKFPYILELEFVMLKSTYVHVSMAKHLENIPMTHKEVFSSFIVTSSIKTTTFKGIEIILANLYFLLVQDLTLSMLDVRLLSMVTKLDERSPTSTAGK
ncbi:hypothetical protein FNV43_RR26429 [Rhamnella rubrinervis]|uniref:Uncharacterized protein n=1 Tax=Rhamnella rubrinervis TaxID=2594499 RepID=A0A8K0GJM2_9ROSA|nr:hypothetical protein FNV43_RR26429 [Rhamnella rubrinervis]